MKTAKALLFMMCEYVFIATCVLIAADESESDDELWIAVVVCIAGGMLIINILTIIIISLYCRHHYGVRNVHELVDSLTKAKEKAKTNQTYDSLPKKDAPEKGKEIYDATYTSTGSVTLGASTEPLGDVHNTDNDDYVAVRNTLDNPVESKVSNVNMADVTMKSNPAYKIHADRTEIDDEIYVPPYEVPTKGSAEAAAVYDYASFDAKTTGDSTAVTGADGDSKMEDYPTYGNIDTIKMNTNVVTK